jgi:hypothetical protein
MVTGQEVLQVPGSGHVSCTVEMVGLNAHADVAVIDEIQVGRGDVLKLFWLAAAAAAEKRHCESQTS